MKKYAFFFIVLLNVACKKKIVSVDNFSSFKKDTIFSKGNQIVFFKPSEEFYQKELIHFEGIEETDADFRHYSNKVFEDVNNKLKLSLKAIITNSRILGIIDFKNDTTFIDRYKDSLHYGTLLNFKDKKYKIDEGVVSSVLYVS